MLIHSFDRTPLQTAHARFVRLLAAALLACGIVALAVLGALFNAAITGGILVVAWVAALVWARPQWAAYLLAVGFPLTAGISRLSQSAELRPNELLLLLLLALLVIRLLALRLPLPRLTWFDVAAMAIILGGSLLPLLTLYGRGESLTTAAVIVLLGPLKNYAVFWTARLALARTEYAQRAITVMLVTSGVVSLIGIAQALQVGPVVHFLTTYYPTKQVLGASSVGRITSVVGGWNDFAAYLCFVLLISIAVAMARIQILPSLLFNGLIALDIVALLITGSIASILGLVAGVLILGVLFGEGARIRRILVLVVLAGVLAGVIFAPLLAVRLSHQFGGGNNGIIPQSLVYRFYLWQTYFLPAIARHPLLGVAPTIPASIPWPTEDSGYLYLLFRGGIIYLLCYLTFTWCCIWGERLLLYPHFPSRILAISRQGLSGKAATEGRPGTRAAPQPWSVTSAMASASWSIVIILLGMNISEAYFTYTAAASLLWMALAISSQHTAYSGTPCRVAPRTVRAPARDVSAA
jgi:hypothetical protein